MSFILDALRKAEHAREGRASPGLVDLPAMRPRRSRLPLVLGGVGALLALNLAVLAVVLLRRQEPPPAASAGPAPAAAAVAHGPPTAPAAHPAQHSVRPLDAEAASAGFDAPPPPHPAAPLPSTGATGHLVTRSAPPTGQPAAAPARTTASVVESPRVPAVPTLNDLPAQVTSGLPHVNIDLHVWNTDPAQRWVVLNGQRLREGGDMKEGPHLEQITPDGVILDYHGTHFLLPRQ